MQNYDQGMVDFGNSLDVAFPAISGCNGINNHFSNNSAAAQAGQPNIRDDGFICYEPVAPARVFIDNENEQGWEPLPQHHRALQPIDFNSYNGESSNAVEYRFDTHHGPQQSQPLYPDVSGQTFNSVFHPNQQSWNQNYTPPVNPQFVCRWCVNTPNSSWTLCYQTFFHLHDLVVHLRTFHIKKEAKATFRCHWDNCQRRDKPFKEKSKLEAHVRTHTGEKPYICKDCKRPFARPENMANHMRIHTGEKPFACPKPACDRRFSSSSDRKKHLDTHSATRKYHCEKCNRSYKHGSSLRKHACPAKNPERNFFKGYKD